jgi:hypothetical protein
VRVGDRTGEFFALLGWLRDIEDGRVDVISDIGVLGRGKVRAGGIMVAIDG